MLIVMRRPRILVTVLAAVMIAASTVTPGKADRGVGVNVGKIEVATSLQPGRGYYLPNFGVLNSGDDVSTYELSIAYLDGQAELRPDGNWFSFQPRRFLLLPGDSMNVRVEMSLPASAPPGDYFALLRAQTVADQPGVTSVGIAAATKLSFTVASAGWFDAQRHRISRWIDDSEPWIYLLPTALLLGFLATKLRGLPFRMRIERK